MAFGLETGPENVVSIKVVGVGGGGNNVVNRMVRGGAQGVLGFLQQHLGCSVRLPASCPKVAKGFGAGIVLRVG